MTLADRILSESPTAPAPTRTAPAPTRTTPSRPSTPRPGTKPWRPARPQPGVAPRPKAGDEFGLDGDDGLIDDEEEEELGLPPRRGPRGRLQGRPTASQLISQISHECRGARYRASRAASPRPDPRIVASG